LSERLKKCARCLDRGVRLKYHLPRCERLSEGDMK
jgi:hypothetical protein